MKASIRKLIPIAALAAGMLIVGGVNSAEAGIRVVLSVDGTADGLGTDVVLTQNGNSLSMSTSIDGYTVALESVLTNFAGNPVTNKGSLTTTTTVNTANAPAVISDLTVLSQVVDDGTSTLSTFTIPTGTNFLVTTNLDSVSGTATSGTANGSTTVNGTTVATASISIPPLEESINSGLASGGPGYTLFNTTVISGLNNSADTVAISLASTVAAVPEPGTLAMAFMAVPLMGVGYRLRRRRRELV